MVAMQTALRKMGNSVGMIVPKAILKELGATAGTPMDVRVEEGKVVATPLRHPREGGAEDAARIGAEPLTDEERDWMGFGNDGDDVLTW
jgi:antitoxin MazE